jgi:hypothetical protein
MSVIGNPRWPHDPTGPRALVECEDPAVQDGLVRVLQEQGYAVAACAGPRARSSGACPLVERGACGLVFEADVVVHALDDADPAYREVLGAIRRRSPGTPVVVEVGPGVARSDDELLAACEQLRFPMTRQSLLDAVSRVTRR